MVQKEKKSKKILEKLINPYLVMIIDEESFEEQIQVRISRLKVIFLGLLLSGIFSGIIFISIISHNKKMTLWNIKNLSIINDTIVL